MNKLLESLVRAATCAPSGDNTQPWQFVVDSANNRISLKVENSRDPSPMNAGGRMGRIAAGAAVQNMFTLAERGGFAVEMEQPQTPVTVYLRVAAGSDQQIPCVAAVRDRVTNRRVYDGKPVPESVLVELQRQTPELDGVTTHWITDRGLVGSLGELVGRGDAAMFGHPQMRQAFLSKVRFDQPANAEVEDGLSLSSLELKKPDRIALQVMRRMPNWLLKAVGATAFFEKHARQLVNSSAGLCWVVAPDASAPTDIAVGRAMQRAWLALSECGLAAQPMMSLLVLENVLEHGDETLVSSLGRDHLQALRTKLRRIFPEIGRRRPAFLLRFGYAEKPSGRTGRRPINVVAVEATANGSPPGGTPLSGVSPRAVQPGN